MRNGRNTKKPGKSRRGNKKAPGVVVGKTGAIKEPRQSVINYKIIPTTAHERERDARRNNPHGRDSVHGRSIRNGNI